MTTFEIIQTLIGSGLIIGIVKLIFSSGKISQQLTSIADDVSQLKRNVSSLDTRLSRLEGAFYERGYWESRKTGTEEKK